MKASASAIPQQIIINTTQPGSQVQDPSFSLAQIALDRINLFITLLGVTSAILLAILTIIFVILGFLVYDHLRQKKKTDDAVKQILADKLAARDGLQKITEIVKKADDVNKQIKKGDSKNAITQKKVDKINRELGEIKEALESVNKSENAQNIYYPEVIAETPFPSRTTPIGNVSISYTDLDRLNQSIDDLRGTVTAQYKPEEKKDSEK